MCIVSGSLTSGNEHQLVYCCVRNVSEVPLAVASIHFPMRTPGSHGISSGQSLIHWVVEVGEIGQVTCWSMSMAGARQGTSFSDFIDGNKQFS
jgi:hypothetical protein